MATSSNILSQTLQSLTTTKIRELHKQGDVYESRKREILSEVNGVSGEQAKVEMLLNKFIDGHSKPGFESLLTMHNASLERIRRFTDQSRHDLSIPKSLLEGFEAELRQYLDQQTKKYDFADLYSKLLEEWLRTDEHKELHKTATHEAVERRSSGDATSLGSFEMVEKDRLQQLKDKFAEVVFEPMETNIDAIERYMDNLFGDDDTKVVLKTIRTRISRFSSSLVEKDRPFTENSLKWVIRGLLKSDLLSEQKLNLLEEFIRNPVVMAEIADVLNMRFKNLSDWTWDAPEGMIIQPRAQLNGKWRVMMDEDILQAILMHYIAIVWSVEIKNVLSSSFLGSNTYQKHRPVPREEQDLRNYYLRTGSGISNTGYSINYERLSTFQKDFFLTHLPDSLQEGARGYDDMDDEDPENPSGFKSPVEIKQSLLRVLATEAIVQRSLYGKVALIQSDLKWFATSLPHSTIYAVWKFFGLSEFWLDLFRNFLEPPVQMSDDPERPDKIRIRKRGVQMATAFEQLFGELVLFPLDVAVNRNAGGLLLYRIHDDLWLCGDPTNVGTAWQIMKDYNAIMGLDFNLAKTGSVHIHEDRSTIKAGVELPNGDVRVGFLRLDGESGNWVIDQRQVTMHAKQLKKQLAACPSVFSWIQTWNSCIGRFFNMTFGEPADCFGRPHVDSILRTHTEIHQELFGDESVTDYLRNVIATKFGFRDVPDAFFFFPEELGGLGLRNPFISLFVIREDLVDDPMNYMHDFHTEERAMYEKAKETFESYTLQEKKRRAHQHHGGEPFTKFMSFADFTKYREKDSVELAETYAKLMRRPNVSDIRPSDKVSDAMNTLNRFDSNISWEDYNSERKWLIQLYSEGVMKMFGGLAIVDKALLPLGVMTMLRKKKITWEAVL